MLPAIRLLGILVQETMLMFTSNQHICLIAKASIITTPYKNFVPKGDYLGHFPSKYRNFRQNLSLRKSCINKGSRSKEVKENGS